MAAAGRSLPAANTEDPECGHGRPEGLLYRWWDDRVVGSSFWECRLCDIGAAELAKSRRTVYFLEMIPIFDGRARAGGAPEGSANFVTP